MTTTEESEVMALRERVRSLEVVQGKITLSPAVFMMVWAVALAVIGAATAAAVSAYQVAEITVEVRSLASDVRLHVGQPWHSAAGVRYDAIEKRVERIEDHEQQKHKP